MFSAVSANSQQAQNTLIKRITQIEITIPAASTSANQAVTIDSVDNCILLYGGVRVNNFDFNRNEYQPLLTVNSNNVTAQCNAVRAADRIVTALLIEFMPFVITKAEKGTIAIGAGVASVQQALVNSYDPMRTVCYYMGNMCTAVSQNISDCLMTTELVNNSTAISNIIARRYVTGTGTATAGFGIVEFAPGILRDGDGAAHPTEQAKCVVPAGATNAFTYFEIMAAPAGTTAYNAGYGIGDPGLGLNFYNGQTGGGFQADMCYADMYDAEGVVAIRNTATPVAGYLVASRVTLSPKWLVYTDFNEFQLDKTMLSDDFDMSYLLTGTYDGTDAPKVALENRMAFTYQGHLTDWGAANANIPNATVSYDAAGKLLQFKRTATSGSAVNLETEVMFTLFV